VNAPAVSLQLQQEKENAKRERAKGDIKQANRLL